MFAPLLRRLRGLAHGSHGERLSKLAIGLTGIASAGMLSFHFAMTLLYVQPNNPLRDEVTPLVNGYMYPYFVQNWELFAPTPEEPSKHLGVVCRFADPGRADTALIDITAPHLEHFHRYRLSPSQRIIRAQVYPLMRVHPQKDVVTRAMERLADSENEAERAVAASIAQGEAESRKRGLRLLARVASAECDRRFPGAELSEVQVHYTHERAPKFSRRNDPQVQGEKASYDYGWQPYERVATY